MTLSELLLPWIDFIRRQHSSLEAALEATTGKPHVADATTVTFLAIDDVLGQATIESAVETLIATAAWPQLAESRLVNLLHRAFTADGTLVAIAEGRLAVDALRPPMPDPADEAAMIRWLFIGTWNVGGPGYIAALTATFLR